ncbi:MAG: T9SS type A sorting domain-containing protein, partial [Ignavibacteria bacterium]
AINVDLPNDGSIAFAVKLLTNFGTLSFYIDSIITDYWNDIMDWKFFEYELDAGEHRLIWQFKNFFDYPANVWLDNIFFPSNSVTTGMNSGKPVPSTFALYQNYPNPFNPITEIKYSLAEESYVKIILFDVLGRKIKDLFFGEQNAGLHEINFNGSDLSSGVYFYGIEAAYRNGIYKDAKKMILLK